MDYGDERRIRRAVARGIQDAETGDIEPEGGCGCSVLIITLVLMVIVIYVVTHIPRWM
ncbi:hypothetical protein [Streptomyces sp. CB02414]|uniref:hypothetical protein n=1 Tax=Streptomyces sp. CB02414 TaxID=1703922 RepID=UPI0013011059|nr:hypothetical protein [Streptomyces sp. CB02414]